MKAANPDIVWLMFAGSDAITSVKQYRSFEMKPPLVYHGWDETFLRAVRRWSRPASSPAKPTSRTLDNPVNKEFVKRYSATSSAPDKPINAIGEATYAAVWLYAKAVAKAGTTEDEKVIAGD